MLNNGILSMPSVIFGELSLIILGPASLGFFSSMMAGKKKSIIVITIVAAKEATRVFGV